MKKYKSKIIMALAFMLFLCAIGVNANAEAKSKSSSLVVVIDAGHGGYDSGAVGNGLREKDLTLKIAQYCKDELKKYQDVEVYMTRSDDTYRTLDQRVEYAAGVKADVFVSMHINSFTSSSAKGVEVYYPNANYKPEIGSAGKNLAAEIQKNLVSLGLSNRGIKPRTSSVTKYTNGTLADFFAVIRGSKNAGFPGIIVEHAFISNPSDAKTYLGSDAALKKMGIADASGIAACYGLVKDGTLAPTKITKLTAKDSEMVNINWNEVRVAEGYQIYRSTSKNGVYKKIKTIKNPETVSYKDTSVKPGKTYYYKIRPYDAQGKAGFSKVQSVKVLKASAIKSVKASSNKLKISWEKLKYATKYQIYRSTSPNGAYQRIATVDAGTLSYVDNTVVSAKKYYYKIRAVGEGVNGKSYSSYSKPKGKMAK